MLKMVRNLRERKKANLDKSRYQKKKSRLKKEEEAPPDTPAPPRNETIYAKVISQSQVKLGF